MTCTSKPLTPHVCTGPPNCTQTIRATLLGALQNGTFACPCDADSIREGLLQTAGFRPPVLPVSTSLLALGPACGIEGLRRVLLLRCARRGCGVLVAHEQAAPGLGSCSSSACACLSLHERCDAGPCQEGLLPVTQRSAAKRTPVERGCCASLHRALRAAADPLVVLGAVLHVQGGGLRVGGRGAVGVRQQALDGGQDRGDAVAGRPLVLDDV